MLFRSVAFSRTFEYLLPLFALAITGNRRQSDIIKLKLVPKDRACQNKYGKLNNDR